MDAAEKEVFLRALVGNVLEDTVSRIQAMPEEWDGHELRAYLADKFADAAMTVGTKRPEWRSRTRAYRNAKLVRPL